jgi:hypothetical protein
VTGDQLSLELYIELYTGPGRDADEVLDVWAGEGRPARLWHRRGNLGSIRSSCLWRPVETVTLAAGDVL